MLIRIIAPLRVLRPYTRPHRFQQHARAMSSFNLNKEIFNPGLYKQIRDIWFKDTPIGATEIDMSVAKQWFMASAEEKADFDGICRHNFARALEAVGPDQFPNPSAEPFLREIEQAVQNNPTDGGAEAACTALSIVLLLDQITRNIYRNQEGLVKVYNHYDIICFSLMSRLLSTDTPLVRPDLHPQWRKSPIFRLWFYLPLIHNEDLNMLEKAIEIEEELEKELDGEEGFENAKMFVQEGLKSTREHRDILRKFGRYPHRNISLGRESTEEEKKFLTEGGATFGVAQTEEK